MPSGERNTSKRWRSSGRRRRRKGPRRSWTSSRERRRKTSKGKGAWTDLGGRAYGVEIVADLARHGETVVVVVVRGGGGRTVGGFSVAVTCCLMVAVIVGVGADVVGIGSK